MGTPLDTDLGTFVADNYKITKTGLAKASQVGATIDLTFKPFDKQGMIDRPIGLIQACKVTRPAISLAEQFADEPLLLERIQASPTGWYIDQYSYALSGERVSEEEAKKVTGVDIIKLIPQTNPVYNSLNTESGKLAKSLLNNTDNNGFGRIYHPTSGQAAQLIDSPSRVLFANTDVDFRHEFETVAVTLNGTPRYLGSVRWGYTARRVGQSDYTVTVIPFAVVGAERPSATFFDAAAAWSAQKLNDYSTKEKIARVAVPVV